MTEQEIEKLSKAIAEKMEVVLRKMFEAQEQKQELKRPILGLPRGKA